MQQTHTQTHRVTQTNRHIRSTAVQPHNIHNGAIGITKCRDGWPSYLLIPTDIISMLPTPHWHGDVIVSHVTSGTSDELCK